jgi:hypothetical protein
MIGADLSGITPISSDVSHNLPKSNSSPGREKTRPAEVKRARLVFGTRGRLQDSLATLDVHERLHVIITDRLETGVAPVALVKV